MIFVDRIDAGKKLAKILMEYKNNKDAIALGLPRGGVIVTAQVAKELNIPLDIIVTRKIGAPGFEELAIGAITQNGKPVLNKKLIKEMDVDKKYIDKEVEKEKKEASRRLKLYRKDRPALNLQNKIAIIIDDGIATGYTMKAAIESVKEMGAKKIIAAMPVAPTKTIEEIKKEVNNIVCLETPIVFYGIGQFYKNFEQTQDEEVIELMNKKG